MARRANGEGTIRKRRYKNGKVRYFARVTVGRDPATGRQITQDGPSRATQSEARQDLRSLTDAAGRGALDGQRVRLDTFLALWLEHHGPEIRPRTLSTYKSVINTHILPRLGRERLRNITPLVCQRLQADVAAAVSPATARKVRQCFRAALEQAVRWELLDRNPFSLVKALPAPRAELGKWSPDDAAAFLQVAKADRLFALFYLILNTGLRAGEAMGLQWVDLEGSRLSIRRQLITVGTPRYAPPKTQRSVRQIALHAGAVAVLGDHLAAQVAAREASPAWQDNGLMFCATNGAPLRLENVRKRHFLPIIEAAGVPRIRIHDLRHYHLSRLHELGVPSAQISQRAGHSRISTTMDIYVSALEGAAAEAPVLPELAIDG